MANVPYLSGYSPLRWKFGIDVILLKKPGNCNIDRFYTILLYEADFNMINKQIGLWMMQYGETYGVLALEQCGSRKNRTAIECALNKRLIFDIMRQTKTSAGIYSCDLKGCYDRILHNFASIAMQRCGAPRSAIESMFTTI